VTARTVLVTGSAGGLGRALVAELKRAGWRVRALVHRRPVAEADESVADLGGLAGVDAVVHAAAVTHARDPQDYAVNAELTAEIVAAAGNVERILLVGTRAAGGAYAASKRRAEESVRASAAAFTIVRLPEVYGAGGREGIDRLIDAARRGRPILLVGGGGHEVSPLYVDDAVAALVRALEVRAAAGRTYTLWGDPMTMRAAAETCRRVFGSRSPLVPVPVPAVRTASALSRLLPLPLYPDQLERLQAPRAEPSPEAETDLGFRPRPFVEGLRRLQSAA